MVFLLQSVDLANHCHENTGFYSKHNCGGLSGVFTIVAVYRELRQIWIITTIQVIAVSLSLVDSSFQFPGKKEKENKRIFKKLLHGAVEAHLFAFII